jgi:hypothetical protein
MTALIDDHRAAHRVESIYEGLPIAPSTYQAYMVRRADAEDGKQWDDVGSGGRWNRGEFATRVSVDWFNHRRFLEPIGGRQRHHTLWLDTVLNGSDKPNDPHNPRSRYRSFNVLITGGSVF